MVLYLGYDDYGHLPAIHPSTPIGPQGSQPATALSPSRSPILLSCITSAHPCDSSVSMAHPHRQQVRKPQCALLNSTPFARMEARYPRSDSMAAKTESVVHDNALGSSLGSLVLRMEQFSAQWKANLERVKARKDAESADHSRATVAQDRAVLLRTRTMRGSYTDNFKFV